ncbi:MAG: HNH endonuclease [Actinomycetota bacterium]|nr:HNH endonuclease [Actinomycetota bacterium]
MFEQAEAARATLREAVAILEPDVVEAQAAKRLVEIYAEIERLAAAGKALAARRVASSGSWRSEGDRSPAHWMARATATSVGGAVGMLETADRMRELPETEAAMRAGRLSENQAKEIASAAAASPSSEGELLRAAEEEGLAGLKQRCARARAAALPDELARYEQVRKRRRLRHWTDAGGAFRLDALLTPDAGAVVLAALQPHQERMATDARRQGRREPFEAYLADALVALAEHARDCDQEPVASGPKTLVHVRVDHSALTAGEVREGEVCEIPGVGPIPAATAQALANDAVFAALVVDGTDVKTISHLGRNIPARLRTALQERDLCCAVPGCEVSQGLEIDHSFPVTKLGRTELPNLDRLCKWHHYLKTHRGFKLSGAAGARRWEPPERAGPAP